MIETSKKTPTKQESIECYRTRPLLIYCMKMKFCTNYTCLLTWWNVSA